MASRCGPGGQLAARIARGPKRVPGLDELPHGRPVRELDPEDLLARVRVRVEVDEANGTVAARAGTDVRLRDRMVAAEDDRKQPGVQHLTDGRLDRGM